VTEPLTDAALDARLKAHFDALAKAHTVPAFDTQWSMAEARLRNAHRGRRRVGAAAIAAGAMLFAWIASREELAVPDQADERLLSQLTSSTAWGAPSDRWLAPPDLEILTPPRLEDMTRSTALEPPIGGTRPW
jgi:hypothetical protein